jgi:PKD repeat protein
MRRRLSFPCATLAAFSLAVLVPAVAGAANAPAVPVPQERWGTLEPRGIPGDDTDWNGSEPDCGDPFWFSIDAEGGYLFTATGNTVEVWEPGTNPGDPEPLQSVCQPVLGTFKKSDTDFFFFHVDAPPNDPSIFAVGVGSGMGLVVMDHATPGKAFLRYQDEGQTTLGKDYSIGNTAASSLAAMTTTGGRDVVYVLTSKRQVLAYDLDRVRGLTSPCLAETGCGSNVYLGELPQSASSIAGVGSHLMLKWGTEILVYDIDANPAQPTLVGSVGLRNLVNEITAWERNGKTFVAGAGINLVETYDLSCLATGCAGKQTVLQTPGSNFAKASKDPVTGKTYLYVGSNNSLVGGVQLEYFFDTESWEDLTPHTHPSGYWGWYYEGNPTGFNQVKPWQGVVYANHLYRAAHSIFDVHEIVVGGPPNAGFTWSPTQPYAGDPVSFTDQSVGAPTAWSWQFEDANVSALSGTSLVERNPSLIEFLSPGVKDVTLVASNENGASDPKVNQVTVLDPAPVITSVTPNVTSAPVCSEILFTANAGGKLPLTFDWDVVDAGNEVVDNGGTPGAASTFTWIVPEAQTPGPYRARLVISGVGSTPAAFSPAVTIQALPELAFLDGADQVVSPTAYQPAASASNFGKVDFSVKARGATKWTWNFGDGNCPAGFTDNGATCSTTDPALGENPSHQYTVAFQTHQVTVTVENCRDGQITSASRQVEVGAVAELKAEFKIDPSFCAGSGITEVCGGNVNQPITFANLSDGFPDSYEVDWTGSGNFVAETPNASGKFTHAYGSPGIVTPKLRAKRGAETKTFTHAPITIGTAAPASVSVTRSNPSPQINANLTLTATANNCSAPSSWTWSIGSGGSFNGGTTTASVSVKYSTAGLRTVTATANGGGCAGKSGSATVNVQSGAGGGGGGGGGGAGGGGGGGGNGNLSANFAIVPAAPNVGSELTFDASSSSGGATAYVWDFGDGATGQGVQAKHAYQQAGSYLVELEVSKPGDSCPFQVCVASTQKTVVVTGGGGNPVLGGNGCSGEAADDKGKLCLLDGRFEVSVDFDLPTKGVTKGQSIWSSEKTGFFWFSRPTNVELIVKVLDGRPVNGKYWVFYGSLTSLPYEITVKDLETGTAKVFPSIAGQAGEICGGQFTEAFEPGEETAESRVQERVGVIGDPGTGTEPTDTLSLLGDRFKVTVDWSRTDPETKETISGKGTAVPGTDQSGYFWFFNEDNLELVVKMVDGRDPFGHFWVFYGGLTSVQYTLTVEDTVENTTKTYEKAEGGICGRSDTAAFAETL